jgi:hypothetical protein
VAKAASARYDKSCNIECRLCAVVVRVVAVSGQMLSRPMTRRWSSNFTAKVNVRSLLSAGRLLGAEILASDAWMMLIRKIAARLLKVKE